MRRAFSLIIVIALLLCTGASAFAAPVNEHVDDFYWRNTRKFDYSAAGWYEVNSEDGYVTAWTSPAALQFVENLPNGKKIYVQAQYKGWATAAYLADGRAVDANEWLPMDMLAPVYTTREFFEEFADSIDLSDEYRDFFADYEIQNQLCFYAFPGGDMKLSMYELAEGDPLQLSAAFVDGDGNRWGYCAYYNGADVDGWIRLDEPENSGLPETLMRDVLLVAESADVSDESLPKLRYDYVVSGAVYAAAAAAVAAVAAAVLLVCSSVKRRRKLRAALEELEE